jgi:hypothetical protein
VLRLAASFVLGYHGCDRAVADQLLAGEPFRPSANDYDWLGGGIYFWEANPQRGLAFAERSSQRPKSKIKTPAVVGAIIDLGVSLDLTTTNGVETVLEAHSSFSQQMTAAGFPMPVNQDDLRRQLDCAIIEHVHLIYQRINARIDSVRGVFTEGKPIYTGSRFDRETHVQIAIRNPDCIKGVFRVPEAHLGH